MLFLPRGLMLLHTGIVLSLAGFCKSQSWGSGPPQTVTALVGEDVTLPCHLEPAADVVSKSVEWGRRDLEPRFVHVWHEGQNFLNNQNPSYKGRTSVSVDSLRHGDLSLRLSAVKLSDNGVYRCYFPSQSKESNVRLIVGSVHSALITNVSVNSSIIGLQCESRGWYPEPEALWLDDDGNIISTEQTETVKGPDRVFTIISRLTVETRVSDSFTCRVQQKSINHYRDATFQFSAGFFETSSPATRIGITVGLLIVAIAITALALRMRNCVREAKKHQDADTGQRELLLEEKTTEYYEEKKKTLEEDLEKKEEERRDLEEKVHKLTDQCKELKNEIEKLKVNREETERITKDIEEKFKSAETTGERDKAEGFMEMKTVALKAKNHLKRGEKEDQNLQQKTLNIYNSADSFLKTLRERKTTVEKQKKEITEQLEETEKKLSKLKT